ncbi:MAG TPA: AMP-binding protein [Candidatus Bathyarchaeia archaeon]|nr:AMP-binding protein [Candidatus Bathyarchaeia archaeon]
MPLTKYMIRHVHWPLMEKWKGNRTRKYMRELQDAQKLTSEQLAKRQTEKLLNLLQHATSQIPAYQSFRNEFSEDFSQPAERLRQLPVLTKKSFRETSDRYLAPDVLPATLIPNRTGGSTGEPTRFYLDRATVERYEAARWLGLSWHNIGIGDPCVMIWGNPLELNQQQSRAFRWKERFLKNRLLLSAYELRESQVPAYLRLIRSFSPSYLYGYASALHLFAELILQKKETLGVSLKAVVSTAERLHPFQRESMEKAFGAPVVNEYGARDGGIIAYECPAGRMHAFTDNCYMEVVDPVTKEPVPPGMPGLLLVTDLHNYVMPRLRYELGDIVQLSTEPCSCGIAYPVLDQIDGREDDMFLSSHGHYVHGHYFNHIMRNLESFYTFQLIQHAPKHVSLKLVKHPDKYDPAEEEMFLASIRKALGDDVKIEVAHVDQIPPSASGKFRYAIREFPLTEGRS